jgi:hypothetical protein
MQLHGAVHPFSFSLALNRLIYIPWALIPLTSNLKKAVEYSFETSLTIEKQTQSRNQEFHGLNNTKCKAKNLYDKTNNVSEILFGSPTVLK